MKIKILLLIIILSISNISLSEWSDPVRLTNGGNDRNPSFRTNQSFIFFYWEFMVFERKSGSNYNVCVSRIGPGSALEDPYYITSEYNNINPDIAYNSPRYPDQEISYALILWQTYRNGNYDIYGSKYVRNIGWSQPFVVDSSAGDQTNPRVVCIDSVNFGITYSNGDDIICKRYNIISNSFSAIINLTENDTSLCKNPHVNFINFYEYYSHLMVTYEKEISPNIFGIFYRFSVGEPDSLLWSVADTLAMQGNNRNQGFNSYTSNANCIFESNRNGTWDIFITRVFFPSNNKFQSTLISGPLDKYGYAGMDYGITDNLNAMYGYFKKTGTGLKAVINAWLLGGQEEFDISNDVNYATNLSVSGDVRLSSNCFRYWIVYNKSHELYPDSTGLIYGKYVTNCYTNINSNESQPDVFSLSQNYPNPFNPVTNIKLSLPTTQYTILQVFDISGREVATLVNEKLQAGSYEFTFDANELSSGIYFYQLKTDEFVQTRKMVLTK